MLMCCNSFASYLVSQKHKLKPELCPSLLLPQQQPMPNLDELLEGTVDWRSDLDALVEIHCRLSTLRDAFWGEFEFL